MEPYDLVPRAMMPRRSKKMKNENSNTVETKAPAEPGFPMQPKTAKRESTESPWNDLLSREEAAKLLHFFKPSGKPGFTEEEVGILWQWAEKIRFQTSMLDAALEGAFELSLRGGEIVFRLNPQLRDKSPSLTETGAELAEDTNGDAEGQCSSELEVLALLGQSERLTLVGAITDCVACQMRERAEEVLKHPGLYGSNLTQIRAQICCAVAADLHDKLGDYVEELLKKVCRKSSTPSQG